MDNETNLPKAGVVACIVATALVVIDAPVILGLTAKLKELVAVAAVIVGLLPFNFNLLITPLITIEGWLALLVLAALLPLPLWSYQIVTKPLLLPTNVLREAVSKSPAVVKPISWAVLSLLLLTLMANPV